MNEQVGHAARQVALTIEVRLSHDARRGGVALAETTQFLRDQLASLDDESRRGVIRSFERNVAAKDPRYFETIYGVAGPVLLDLLQRAIRESLGDVSARGQPALPAVAAAATREVVAAANFALARIQALPAKGLRPEDAILEFVLADRGKIELRVDPRLELDKGEIKAAARRILEDARRAPANLEIVRRPRRLVAPLRRRSSCRPASRAGRGPEASRRAQVCNDR